MDSSPADLQSAPWADVVSEHDVELLARAGFGGRAQLQGRPAVLVIDVQYRTVGHQRVPIETAMEEYPTACGLRGWSAVDRIVEVLGAARKAGAPVLYPMVAPKTGTTAGRFRDKSPTLASPDAEAYRIVEEVAPADGDRIVGKDFPSAFFATPLLSHLIEQGVSSLIVTGCTTSGCVRATTVDAFSYGFNVAVVGDGVYDRTDLVHQANLFDIDSKYANVIPAADAVGVLEAAA